MHDRVNAGYLKKKRLDQCLLITDARLQSLWRSLPYPKWPTSLLTFMLLLVHYVLITMWSSSSVFRCSGTHDRKKLKCWDFSPPGFKQRVNIFVPVVFPLLCWNYWSKPEGIDSLPPGICRHLRVLILMLRLRFPMLRWWVLFSLISSKMKWKISWKCNCTEQSQQSLPASTRRVVTFLWRCVSGCAVGFQCRFPFEA